MARSKVIEGLKDAVRHARAENGNPHDVCKCGDYRRDHKDGYGPCVFNAYEGGPHGDSRCRKFRLSKTAEEGGDLGRPVPPHGSGPDNQ